MTDQEMRLECVRLAVEHVGGKFSPDEIVNAAKAIYGFVIDAKSVREEAIADLNARYLAGQAQQFQSGTNCVNAGLGDMLKATA